MHLDFSAKNVLLLQGPVGPFFRRFANELRERGIQVTKVNFSAGDELFYRGADVVPFRAPRDQWPDFFRNLVTERNIDAVFLFGDCRPMHKQAKQIASELGLPVWVFEEGYLRPDFVTLERGGVNGHSSLPKDPEFYRMATNGLPELPDAIQVGNTFRHAALYAALNATAVTFLARRYPHYRHHRNINAFWQASCWARGFARKAWYAVRERGLLDKLSGDWSGYYFFVPLQVHCDAQMQHARFESMEEFIEEVISSFAEHAPKECFLVLKHHPHDRAYRDYGAFISELGERYRCARRVLYVHDLHLPTLLKNARGTITMNSTVGISSLHHGTPVKVLGEAVYDIPELTCQEDLAHFFRSPGEVDAELYSCFYRWLREANQVNGSFYRRSRRVRNGSGVDLELREEGAAAPASRHLRPDVQRA